VYIAYTTYTAYNVMWLTYHSSLHGSTGSILDCACINQLASSDSSLSSRNIVLKASVILFLYSYSISLLISISYLLTSNLFLLSSISRNIGYSFLKRLGGNKIRN